MNKSQDTIKSNKNNNEHENKTISILGAGWLGLPLAKYFLSEAYRVKLATRSEGRLKELNTLTRADLFQFDIEETVALEFLNADILVINIPNKNISAFSRLVDVVAQSAIKKIIFVSSTSVYKNVNRTVIEHSNDENTRHPLFQIEQLFLNETTFATTVLRFSGLVGYGRHPGNWFKNKTVPHPEAPINLIHRDDCIGIIHQIIKQDAWGEIFNGCSTTHPTKRDFYCYARQLLKRPSPEFEASSELRFKLIGNEKIKAALNYKFIHPDLMQLKEF